MNIKNPKFSIIMANYNNGKYIAEAIVSVINQTFKDWELIIIDDCSSDNSVETIRLFLNDNRINFFKNKKNIGYVSTLKELINKSKAEIIGVLDSDDALTKNALEIIVNAYDERQDCGFIYSQFAYHDMGLNFIKNGYCNYIPPGLSNLHCNSVSHFKTFKRKEYFKTMGYDKNMIYSEDKDLILKIEEVTRLYFVDKVLYKYRVLPNSQGNDPKKALLGKLNFIIIKLNAYKRRINSNIPNLTKDMMIKELIRGMYYGLKSRKYLKVIFFLKNIIKLFFKI